MHTSQWNFIEICWQRQMTTRWWFWKHLVKFRRGSFIQSLLTLLLQYSFYIWIMQGWKCTIMTRFSCFWKISKVALVCFTPRRNTHFVKLLCKSVEPQLAIFGRREEKQKSKPSQKYSTRSTEISKITIKNGKWENQNARAINFLVGGWRVFYLSPDIFRIDPDHKAAYFACRFVSGSKSNH